MKKFGLSIAVLLAATGVSFAQSPALMKFFGQLESMNESMSKAVESIDHAAMENIYIKIADLYDQQSDEVKSTVAPMIGGVWYNIACMRSLQKNTDGALDALSKAVELGWNDYSRTVSDPDLDAIRSNPRFKKIIAKIR